MSYSDELVEIGGANDSVFPPFLFTPLFNDFEDNYYKKSIVDDTLSINVRGLRRKYSNFFDYCDALTIYNEFMEKLVDKYGSMSIIKNGLKVGLLEEAVPPKPKLKNTRRNREFLRAKTIPSRPIRTESLSEDEYVDMARSAFPNQFGENIDEAAMFTKLDPKTRKLVKRMQEKLAGSERRKNLYRTTGNNNGADFIVEYLNQATKGYYDESGVHKEHSLLEIIAEEEKYAMLPPELVDAQLTGNKSKIVNGRLVRSDEYAQIEIMKELYSVGIDVLGNLSKSMNKQSIKMIRSSIGDGEPMTKKELRRMKQQHKKDQQMIERRRDSDRTLERALLNNKFDFAKNGENLSFRMKDLYRER